MCTNPRIYHLLPECISFNQSALRYLLPECIVPGTIRGCLRMDSSEKLCFDLPVKLFEGDRDLYSTLSLLFSMPYVKVCRCGRLIVASYFKLSMSFLSSLASVVEFLNQMNRNRRA